MYIPKSKRLEKQQEKFRPWETPQKYLVTVILTEYHVTAHGEHEAHDKGKDRLEADTTFEKLLKIYPIERIEFAVKRVEPA